jgi:hypothetical protein
MSSTSNDTTLEPRPVTYNQDEVQELLDDARLDGWQEGLEEGQRMEKKKREEGKMKSEEKVAERGVEVRKDEED